MRLNTLFTGLLLGLAVSTAASAAEHSFTIDCVNASEQAVVKGVVHQVPADDSVPVPQDFVSAVEGNVYISIPGLGLAGDAKLTGTQHSGMPTPGTALSFYSIELDGSVPDAVRVSRIYLLKRFDGLRSAEISTQAGAVEKTFSLECQPIL